MIKITCLVENAAMASLKTSDIEIYVPERTFFNNSKTGETFSRYGSYDITSDGADAGWEAINQSAGYVETKGHMLIYFIVLTIFSPVLVFTQALGTIMAFVAIFTRHVYSTTGEILLQEVPAKVIQAPLAVLCSFVFC